MLILFFILLFILLLFPEAAADGSKNGLVLWATVLVPSLLPFSILTSLVRKYMQGKPFHYLLLAAGVLSGYPIGAKIAGELYTDGVLSKKKALFFAGFTNNPSPMFVIFFVAGNMLHLSEGKYTFYLLLLVSSLLGSLTFTFFTREKKDGIRLSKNNTLYPCSISPSGSCPGPPLSLSKVIDTEISASALLLIKIGGYIMLFSIITALIQKVPYLPASLRTVFCGLLEITTGNVMIAQAILPHSIKIILSLAATTFGGLSAAAQTNSVLQKTGLPVFQYVLIKLISSLYAALLAFLFL